MGRKLSYMLMILSFFISNILAQDVDKSMYRITIKTEDGFLKSGGFVINESGFLITNYSILKLNISNSITVSNTYGTYTDIIGIKGIEDKNLAILKIQNYDKSSFVKFQNPNDIKDGILTFTYDINGKESKGKIVKIFDSNISLKGLLIQTSSVINRENIGTPLVGEFESVVGVNVSRKGDKVYLALHVKDVLLELEKLGIKYHILDKKSKFNWFWIGGIFLLTLVVVVVKKRMSTQKYDTKKLKPMDKNLSFVECENGKSLLVGRSVECDLVILDPEVSKQHCVLKNKNGIFTLQNLNPKNGTFINGVKLNDSEIKILNQNDNIGFGSKKIMYEVIT